MEQLTIMQKTAITLLTVFITIVSMGGCPKEEADNMGNSQKKQIATIDPNRPSAHSVEILSPNKPRPAQNPQPETPVPTIVEQPAEPVKYEKATFAAGCFWGVEASFRTVEGVVATQVGYIGGQQADPTYRQVCTDKTGHAEAVEVTYDPKKASFEDLLDLFWKIHDPTTLNRQGPDVGTQYRSAVFYHTPQQKALAQESMQKLEKARAFKSPITTKIVPAPQFYKAEEYHQRYLEKQGKTSCSSTIH